MILVNPAAGGGLARRILPALSEFAGSRDWGIEIYVAENPQDLAAKARDAARTGRRRILVLGGDGTFQILVNALADFPETILGVIPAGGGNDLATAIGLPEDAVDAASQLLKGEVRQIDAVRVHFASGEERLYTGGGGVGLDAEAALHASGTFKNLRGRLRYLLAALRALFEFRSIPVRIRIEGSESMQLEATALLVGILNTPNYGAGLYLAPSAKVDDGKLDLVVLEHLRFHEVLALLPSLALKGELKTKRVRRFLVDRVCIDTDMPRWFHGDGELFTKTPVEISVARGAIRLLCPSRSRRLE